jgi:hypothetical protein
MFFPVAGAVVCVSFVFPCVVVCCSSVVWAKAMSGSADAAIAVSTYIFNFLLFMYFVFPTIFGPDLA